MRLGFVVEGLNDKDNVLLIFPTSQVAVTQGTRLNNRVRMDINNALNNCHTVYLLTDPDEAGNLLANKLLAEFPMLKRIILDPEQCKCYRNGRLKIGVEHASVDYLLSVFRNYM